MRAAVAVRVLGLRVLAVGAALFGSVLLAGCSPPAGRPASAAAPPGTTAADAGPATALGLLGELAERGRGPHTGYTRARFGPAWADTDRNGCDTRDDVLSRDLLGVSYRPGTHDCVVLSGHFREPYTGREVTFAKAHADAVQIDHVVALSDAWQKGAASWSDAERLTFANDPLELLATDGPTNQAKGDSDAASWLPPDVGYRCRYAARQVAVKHAYALSVTAAERAALLRVLGGCPAEPVPTGGDP